MVDFASKLRTPLHPMRPDLILYHAQCPDGACSAWVALQTAPDAEAIPVLYNQPPPDVRGRKVLIADFSYRRPVLEQMAESARQIVVLDHHKTAQAELAGLPFCTFDMERSGARMVWDYLNPGKDPPWIVLYVEDRDLWRNELPRSAEIACYINTLGFTDWQAWSDTAQSHRDSIADAGHIMLKLRDADVRRMKERSVMAQLAGHRVPVAAAPVHESEVAGGLAQDHPECPFAAAFYQRADGLYSYSLRSRALNRGPDRDPRPPFDVSTIARLYGGGGHAQAAGFAVPHLVHAICK